MTSGEALVEEGHRRPGLAMTYEGRAPGLLDRVLPLVDYIEVTPDSVAELRDGEARLHAPTMAELKAIGAEARIIVHGVGLTIGSHEGYSERYLRLLDDVFAQVDVAWHSEHLAYTTVDGEHLGTMLAVPKTEQVLEMVCERVDQVQRRYGCPFLLENVIHLLPDYDGPYSDAAFFNRIAANTGCGLLLDAYNLECDAHNQGFDIPGFLAELEMDRVREIHVANGMEHRGLMLDMHSRRLRDSTISLAQEAIDLAGGAVQAVTYELLGEAVPVIGHDGIVEELARLRGHLLQPA